MRLTEISIRQPVLAIVFNLALLVIGVVGFMRLDLRFFPIVQSPLVTIKMHYQGADPQLMENTITTPLENAIASAPNIQALNSWTSDSWTTIWVHFLPGTNFEDEVNSVRDHVAAARVNLPVSADPPSIDTGSVTDSVLNIDFIDPQKQSAQIRDYVEHSVTPLLRQVPGVGSIDVVGASDYAMRIWLDSAKMTALNVTVTDIENALNSNNINFPAGQIQHPTRNYTIISNTRLKTPQDFANIIITQNKNRTIRFGDVADVKLGYTSLQDAPMRVNSLPAIDVAIHPLQGANSITVAEKVKRMLSDIKRHAPPGMQVRVDYDASIFLKSAIHETFMSIFEAVLLVIIVVFLFLGSVRAATIPIVTIPVCIISVFGLMYFLGFTINVMSLLAIVLAIGLVVDDAIVMLENIHRHIEEGETPLQAALKGSKEIATPVIAMTLTLAAVYAPIGLSLGFTAEIFKEFAFTLAGAVLISGFVALTLSPMMCAKILTSHTQDNEFTIYLDQFFERIAFRYQAILTRLLEQRLKVVYILAALAALGLVLYLALPSEFIPKEDTGFLQGTVTAPTGANLDYTDKYVRQIEKIFAANSDIHAYLSMVSTGSSQEAITLKNWGERKHSTQEVANKLNPILEKIPGVNAYISIPDPIQYAGGGSDFNLHLVTTGTYQDLLQPAQQLTDILKKYPGLTRVDQDLKYDAQQYAMSVNRDLAAVLGVNISNIATTISVMMGGAHVTDVLSGTASYQVLLQIQKKDLQNFSGINKLYVRSSSGQMIPLSSLINLSPTIGQPGLGHYNRLRAATITGQLSPGYSISQAVNYTLAHLPKVLTPGMNYAFDGKAQEYIDSAGNMTGIFVMAIIFIYLVLSAQFGSFIDPFIILLTVPLSIVGALLALTLGGGSINLYSQIGLVTLVGMITKHGILITQFANQLRIEGLSMYEAVIKASAIRLRPILMTTMAMVFGSLPLALATGPGSIGRHQIGWVIVGGLLVGTFFSLVVVPIAYTYFGHWKKITS